MPESYQPGQREPRYGQNHRFTEDRYAWVQVEAGKYLIIVGKDNGHGQDVVLFHPRPGKIPDLKINLTNLTAEELVALRDLFNTAFDWARPVVERRDKEAQDAWDSGDDSHSRNYRPLPTVVYRKEPISEHGEGVHERPEGVPESNRGGGTRRVRGAGDELAEPVPPEGESEDDGSASD